jgi:hypothetical protein
MIPLILEGQLEDVILFRRQIELHLSVKAAMDVIGIIRQEPINPEDRQGYLPQDLMDLFEEHFGVAYKPYSVISDLVRIDPLHI